MYKTKTAIMCTGGIDSTTLLYMNKEKNPMPITVDYGQVAFQKQVEMLQYHIEKLGLPALQIIKINFPEWQRKEGLFKTGYKPDENAPLADWEELRYADFFVEGRNQIMLSYVMAFCSVNKIDEILTGYLYGEEEWTMRRSYKLMTGDNSPQFVDAMNQLSSMGFSHQLRIRAPFYEQYLSKLDVFQLGKELNINYKMTYSCYFIPACGVCDNCLLRKNLNI